MRAGQDEDRRVYELTETGRSARDEHAEAIQQFWARFTGTADPRMGRPEVGFVRDELHELTRTVWDAVRAAMTRGDDAEIREIRSAVERSKNEVREIIARGGAATAPTADTSDIR